MKKIFCLQNILLSLFIYFFISSQVAFAYINPGTGSDFFQMFIGIFLGLFAFIKSLFRRLKSLFGLKVKEESEYE